MPLDSDKWESSIAWSDKLRLYVTKTHPSKILTQQTEKGR
jgi:hypothetical protein